MPERFSQHLHLKHGKLGDWCEHCSSSYRHAALRKVAAKDGAGEVSLRLNVLANLSHRKNPQLAKVARTDQRWVSRELEGKTVMRE